MLPKEFIFPTIAVPNGGELGVALPCLRRGQIKKLRVVQLDTGSDLTGFSYTLYNAKAACPPGADPTTVAAAAGVVEQLYRVSPTLVVAAGKDQYAGSEGYPEDGISNLDLAFACIDAHDPALRPGPTNQGHTLYLKIKSTAGGGGTAKTFGIAMTIIDPQL